MLEREDFYCTSMPKLAGNQGALCVHSVNHALPAVSLQLAIKCAMFKACKRTISGV
jgi:hypothetical protein